MGGKAFGARPLSGARRPLTAEEVERVRALRAAGKGLRTIARELGRGQETVRAAYEEMGEET